MILSSRYLYFRLKQYDLDDDLDNVANYIILSLQTEQIVPQLSVSDIYYNTFLLLYFELIENN